MSRQIQEERLDGGRAVVAARAADSTPDTEEIERLARAAGFEVVATVTQRRREHSGTWLGRGKAERLADRAAEADADTVVVDGGLTPGQYANLLDLLSPGVELVDRYRLVLDIFAQGADDRRAALQVRAATLRYELPRLRRTTEESLLNRATEKGSPVLDAERRIDRIESKLDALAEDAAERRERRREAGLGLVAIAGYTNAGKTTLLHRLAADLSVEERREGDGTAGHEDADDSTPVADELFVTLGTTTRRGEGDLPVVYTDTVGLLDGLPHELVASFSTTLDEVASADVALLVVDATDDPDRLREKVRVSLDEMGDPDGELLGVLNKVDELDDGAVAERRAALADLVPAVVAVSALEGTGVARLRERVRDLLPTERATFELPNGGPAQSFLAWAHEHGSVGAQYDGEVVRVTFESRSEVVERARGRVDEMVEGAV